jgi:hypothetical protein
MPDKLCIVTLVNNEYLYARSKKSLERQADTNVLKFIPIDADINGWNAARALNSGIDESHSEWVLCTHQDVIFPDGWIENFSSAIRGIPDSVVIIGLVGVRANGSFAGHIKDPNGHQRYAPLPASVFSIDEHVIIIRRDSGIRFDEANPNFHCYGADICLSARKQGFDCIVIDAPVIHLSTGKLDYKFRASSEWLLRKWGKDADYIIPTCAAIIYKNTMLNYLHRALVRLNRRLSAKSSKSKCTCNNVYYSEI